MDGHEEHRDQEESAETPTVKGAYEPPDIVEEGTFETVVLACGGGDPFSCPGSVHS